MDFVSPLWILARVSAWCSERGIGHLYQTQRDLNATVPALGQADKGQSSHQEVCAPSGLLQPPVTFHPVLAVFAYPVDRAQTRVSGEDGASSERLPLSAWPVGRSVSTFFLVKLYRKA